MMRVVIHIYHGREIAYLKPFYSELLKMVLVSGPCWVK